LNGHPQRPLSLHTCRTGAKDYLGITSVRLLISLRFLNGRFPQTWLAGKGTLESAMAARFPALEIVHLDFQIPGIRDRLVTLPTGCMAVAQ
jgi:hypothetical protein